MDITLERILSLIPKKPNGDFVHGAKKKFALSIGYDDGQIISMWENGSSVSYKKKIHEISDRYDVSVEWLKGKSDIKEKAPADKIDKGLEEFDRLFNSLPPEIQARELAYLRELVNELNK